jgi:transposase-like protein
LQRFDAVNPSKTGQISRASRNEFIDAARPARHATGDRWFIDETYVKVAGRWIYLYRAVDQRGQVIDVLISTRRDTTAARAFFLAHCAACRTPVEVTTDRAPVYPRVVDELVPRARHVVEQYANNIVEADRRPVEIAATADARAQATRLGAHHRRRTRVRAEPTPRPLRHRG